MLNDRFTNCPDVLNIYWILGVHAIKRHYLKIRVFSADHPIRDIRLFVIKPASVDSEYTELYESHERPADVDVWSPFNLKRLLKIPGPSQTLLGSLCHLDHTGADHL